MKTIGRFLSLAALAGLLAATGCAAEEGGAGAARSPADAVAHALAWLATHQSADGRWEAEGYSRWCDGRAVAAGPAGAGEPAHDVGVTALALLAFLRAPGIGLRSPKYDAHVARGLDWLRAQQDAEGCVGTRDELRFVYDHAWAALALVEGATANPGSRELAKAAQRALDFSALARNPYFAWRYGVKPGDNDTSVTGAMLAALAAARDADRSRSSGSATFPRPRFEVDLEAFDGAEAWVDKMTDQSSRVGYAQRGGPPARSWEQVDRFPPGRSESLTACGLVIRAWCGLDIEREPMCRKGLALLAKRLPEWSPDAGTIDMLYWYYGTLAFAMTNDEARDAWTNALLAAVLPAQRRDGGPCGCDGSWDPVDPWGPDGGRVYATAVLAMTLEAAGTLGSPGVRILRPRGRLSGGCPRVSGRQAASGRS